MDCECKNQDIIDDMKRDLWGNGKDGLKERVSIMENNISWIKRIGIAIIILLTGNLATMVTMFINMARDTK
jgi:hypothetical protein